MLYGEKYDGYKRMAEHCQLLDFARRVRCRVAVNPESHKGSRLSPEIAGPPKGLVTTFRRYANEVTKFSRWVRRMSARHLINNLPGVARRYQRFRYRNWIRKIDPHWVSSAPRPHFIIIGAPKCGTSWLLAVLKQHPNVRMAPKEIEYFSFHLEYPFEWYLEHFARLTAGSLEPPGSTPLVLGEKSARYCSIPQAQIRRVRELLPTSGSCLWPAIRSTVTGPTPSATSANGNSTNRRWLCSTFHAASSFRSLTRRAR